MLTPFKLLFRLVASYGFAVVILFFLLLLTFFGTLEQVNHGLFEVQKKYFESIFLVHHIGPVPLLLPGAYLLLTLLFFNLLCGAIIRSPKQWKRPGMLIAHGGILLMMLGSLVTYQASTRGYMQLYEGERSKEFHDYFRWEIAITELNGDHAGRQHVIHHEQFATMEQGENRTFFADQLPFDLFVEGFTRNCQPAPSVAPAQGIDGIWLEPIALHKEAEMNAAGAYAIAIDKATQESAEGILYGFARVPWVHEHDGVQYAVDLRKRRYEAPFTIVLEEFIHEQHPGTGMASNYESIVTKIDDDTPRQVHIRMNEPLRDQGYTFFQASFGPKDAQPGQPMFSVFEVVNNPADQWPLYACIIITLGMSLHFVQKLYAYLKRQNRKASA
jgi:hypothetical protein